MFTLKLLRLFFISILFMQTFSTVYAQKDRFLFERTYFAMDIADSLADKDWLGLYKRGDKFILKPCNIKISLVPETVIKDGAVYVQKKVITRPGQPLLMISGVMGVKKGIAKQAEITQNYLNEDDTVTIQFSGKTYQLMATGQTNRRGILTSQLVFIDGDSSQILGESNHHDMPFRIHWAGDLNGDNELDLITGVYMHKRYQTIRVYLSKVSPYYLLKDTAVHRINYK